MRNFELKGQEMYFVELDNKMMANGYYSVYDDGIIKEIKQDKNVCYVHKATDTQVLINFEILVDNEDGEAEEAFYLHIIDASIL